MKTNFKVNIPAINIEKGDLKVEIPAIQVSTELDASVSELRGLYQLQKDALKELPELIRDLVNHVEDMIAQDEYEAGQNAKQAVANRLKAEEEKEEEARINQWFIETVLMPEMDKIPENVCNVYKAVFNHKDLSTFANETYDKKKKFFNVVYDLFF